MYNAEPHIKYGIESHTATLTITSPRKKNAFTHKMYVEFNQYMREAQSNPNVRYILIRGDGDVFSAGNDIEDFTSISNSASSESFASRDVAGVDSVFTLHETSKPVIAAVAGPAVGWGATMLLLCDFILVADTARIMFVFAKLGLMPEAASTFLLAQSIGRHRAKNILMRGGTISAHQAVEYGLALEMVPVHDLYDRANAFINELDTVSYPSQLAIKSMINANFEPIEERIMNEFRMLGELVLREDTQKGFQEFLNKSGSH